MTLMPPWVRCHPGSDATLGQMPPWVRCHPGSESTLGQMPLWVRCHPESDATLGHVKVPDATLPRILRSSVPLLQSGYSGPQERPLGDRLLPVHVDCKLYLCAVPFMQGGRKPRPLFSRNNAVGTQGLFSTLRSWRTRSASGRNQGWRRAGCRGPFLRLFSSGRGFQGGSGSAAAAGSFRAAAVQQRNQW